MKDSAGLAMAGRAYTALKFILDQTLAWTALLVLSPVMWLIAALIRLDSPGPIFFRQERIGLGGRPFISLKFRTMVDRAVTMGLGLNVAVNDSRITRVGRILRNASLDELPQIFNVIQGDMSLVGPRPTLGFQVAAYDEAQRRRLLVKPGITGWAQINGRNAIPWERRIELDVWYVEHQSLVLDVLIMVRTLKVLLRREGLYGPAGINFSFGGAPDLPIESG